MDAGVSCRLYGLSCMIPPYSEICSWCPGFVCISDDGRSSVVELYLVRNSFFSRASSPERAVVVVFNPHSAWEFLNSIRRQHGTAYHNERQDVPGGHVSRLEMFTPAGRFFCGGIVVSGTPCDVLEVVGRIKGV